MRIFTIAGIVFLGLLTVVAGYQVVSSKTENEVLGLAETLEKFITEENTKNSTKAFSSLQSKWQSTRNLLMAVAEHSDLDRVEEHLKNVGSELKYDKFEDAYRELQLFKMLLKNLFLNSKPTITNIL